MSIQKPELPVAGQMICVECSSYCREAASGVKPQLEVITS